MRYRRPLRRTLHKVNSLQRIAAHYRRQSRTTVFLVALACLLLGGLISHWYGQRPQSIGGLPAAYVEFQGMESLAAVGMVVLSLDLEMQPEAVWRVEAKREALDAAFRLAIAEYPAETLYSRAGKEKLALRLRQVANQLVGDELVAGVYFGDFRIYGK